MFVAVATAIADRVYADDHGGGEVESANAA
jgi:hypothetical protein